MKRKLLGSTAYGSDCIHGSLRPEGRKCRAGHRSRGKYGSCREYGGGESTGTDGSYLKDYTASDYVTLGEYKGLEISMTSEEPVVTEEDVDSYIEYVRQMNPVSTPVEGRAVQSGILSILIMKGSWMALPLQEELHRDRI